MSSVYGLRCAVVWFVVCDVLQLCVWVVVCLSVFMRDLLSDVVWFAFRCVFVFVFVFCVLCLMSLHAVCEISCDDVWCSMCVCVCVSFCVCVVCLRFIV